MKLQLTALDRLGMISILPEDGNFLTLDLLDVLKEACALTEKEQKDVGIIIRPDGKMNITDNETTFEIDVPETIFAMVKEKLKDLERTSKLRQETKGLYRKIILEQ